MTVKFPEVLKTLIKNKGITQTTLAKELGLKPNVISMYCNGSSNPEFRTLIKLAEFFDVSIDSLIFGVRSENKILAEELGLSDNALENLKKIASQNQDVSYYINDLLSDKNFFEVFNNAVTYFTGMITYYPIAANVVKEQNGSFNFESLMETVENQAATKILPFLVEFFKEENVIRGIRNQDEYEKFILKRKESQEALSLLNKYLKEKE